MANLKLLCVEKYKDSVWKSNSEDVSCSTHGWHFKRINAFLCWICLHGEEISKGSHYSAAALGLVSLPWTLYAMIEKFWAIDHFFYFEEIKCFFGHELSTWSLIEFQSKIFLQDFLEPMYRKSFFLSLWIRLMSLVSGLSKITFVKIVELIS